MASTFLFRVLRTAPGANGTGVGSVRSRPPHGGARTRRGWHSTIGPWLCALACACAFGEVAAQTYPVKSIRLIVPNAAGSGPDIVARLVGQKLTEAWGQQVIIDPRAGAGGIIGLEMAARAPADGYTLVMVTPTAVNASLMYPGVKFDMTRDFSPISLLLATPYVFAVHPSLPVRSIDDLIKFAKARPDALYFGSGGSGAMPHLCVEVLKQLTGTRMIHVPYKGFTPALNDLVAGQIQVMCSPTAPIMPLIGTGKLRGLGVTLKTATPLAPGLPPVATTVRGFEVSGWYGLFAPAGLPAAVTARINAAVSTAVKGAELQERFASLGVEPVASAPEEMGAVLKEDLRKWGAVIKEIGLRVE